jgi:hypothetical protein
LGDLLLPKRLVDKAFGLEKCRAVRLKEPKRRADPIKIEEALRDEVRAPAWKSEIAIRQQLLKLLWPLSSAHLIAPWVVNAAPRDGILVSPWLFIVLWVEDLILGHKSLPFPASGNIEDPYSKLPAVGVNRR